jgi:subtilisin family serine protease
MALRPLHVFLRAALLLAVSVCLTVAAAPATLPAPPAEPRYAPDVVLVSFRQEAPLARRLTSVQRQGLEVQPGHQSPYFARLRLSPQLLAAGQTVESRVAALRQDPAVRWAEPDWIVHTCAVPNDPRFSEQWGLHNTGQTGGTADADIDAPEAWDQTTGDGSVIVAVVDTGVDYNHPDLTANMWVNPGEIAGNGVDDDANGYVDDVRGWNTLSDNADPMDNGSDSHGTHVAGIIGAQGNNAIGVTGVCQNVKIMPVKCLDGAGEGLYSDAIEAIDYARIKGARVINTSWGTDGNSVNLPNLGDAIVRARDAGVLVVAAAGNFGSDLHFWPEYPASFSTGLDNLMSVAATDHNDALSSFSNFGDTTVDLAAPGENILSTLRNNGYGTLSGTSMAAPFVSGAAALVMSRFPSLSYLQVKQRLLGSADHPPLLAEKVVRGRLNVARALESETVLPGAPTGFRATHRNRSAFVFTWQASGDDGTAGAAGLFELRYSTAPIEQSNFAAATQAAGLPTPGPSGTTHTYLLQGLTAATSYYVALRALDNALNASPLVTLGPLTTLDREELLRDDVEGAPRFSGAGWAVATDWNASPAHSYKGNVGGQTGDLYLTQVSPITLGMDPVVRWSYNPLAIGGGVVRLEVSETGGPWVLTAVNIRSQNAWFNYNLAAYAGKSVRLRFKFTASQPTERFWFDDIQIDQFPLSFLLVDDVEGPSRFTREAPWAAAEEHAHSPTHTYTDSPGGTEYSSNLDSALTQNTAVRLDVSSPGFQFWRQGNLDRFGDFLYAEVSRDGGETWLPPIWFMYGTQTDPGWETFSLPLSYFRQNVKVRFRFVTDNGNDFFRDGVWLDDIRLYGEPLQLYVPPAPANLQATALSATQIHLAWTDPSSEETSFRIERQVGTGFVEVGKVGAGGSAFLEGGLAPNTPYTYQVRAANLNGLSAPSNSQTLRTLRAPVAPSALDASAYTPTQVLLQWRDNSETETGFKVERRQPDGSWTEIATTHANTPSYLDSGRTTGTTYAYRVRAGSGGYLTAYTNTASVTLLPAPAAPTSLNASPVSATQVRLTWTADTANVTAFRLERKMSGQVFQEVQKLSSATTECLDGNLAPNTTYAYRLRAANGTVFSPYSGQVSATLWGAPADPSELTAVATSPTQIKLTWKDNSSTETSFRVERLATGGVWPEIKVLPANSTFYIDSGRTAGVTYSYRVRAVSGTYFTGYTNTSSATP